MTPEEIQQTIQQILAIQRDLQEKQLQNTDNISQLTEDISLLRDGMSVLTDGGSELIEHSKGQDRRLEQLIGYSITAESERLDLEERVRVLERQIRRIENS